MAGPIVDTPIINGVFLLLPPPFTMLCTHELYKFEKRTLPPEGEELEQFAGKLALYGVSLKEYKDSLVPKLQKRDLVNLLLAHKFGEAPDWMGGQREPYLNNKIIL